MSASTVIAVEHLGKNYRLRHERSRGGYVALRDVVTDQFKNLFRRPRAEEKFVAREEFWALRDVNFEVKQGDAVGIIGHNGAGKSTLLKILSRITEPSRGRVRLRGRVASLLEVGTGFHAELTGRENIFLNGAILGMSRAEVRRKFDEIVAFAEVEKFLDTPVKRYSSGMYVRLAFAVAAHLEPEILIVDEVLAVGDAQFQKKCLGKMAEGAGSGTTVLFVSHNLGAVLNLCRRGIVLQNGALACDLPVKDAVEFYQRSVFHAGGENSGREPHVIYEADPERRDPLSIVRIEMLDEKGNPKATVGTWESVTFRLRYRSDRKIVRGSVALQICTEGHAPLIFLETEPTGAFPLDLLPGEHAIDCVFPSMLVSAGDYVIGAGLALPHEEWLWWRPELARLTVGQRDVFRDGLAPVSARCLIAPPHAWRHAPPA